MKYQITIFGDSYSCGAYGAGTYDNACTSTTTGAGSGQGSGLTNAGIMVLGFVSLACLIVFAALVVRIWRHPRKQLAPQAQEDQLQEPPRERDDHSL